MGRSLGMSADWIGDYDRAAAELPAAVARAPWTVAHARKAARAAFAPAPDDATRAGLLSEARRQARHAKTPRRLAGIRQRRPELAELIEDDLAWLAFHTAGFARRPFADRIAYWYEVTGVPDAGGSVTSTRGTSATWPGLRQAAFILLAWRTATGAAPTIGWLAGELRDVQSNLDLQRSRKIARQFIVECETAPGQRSSIVPN